jgi:glycosyltransferase involved in cell wall biosynthesis
MNVCHIIFELRLGGIGAMLQNYALGMEQHATMTCIIFRLSEDPLILERYQPLLTHPQVTIIDLKKRLKQDRLKTMRQCYQWFKTHHYDMVFSHLEEVTRYVWWISLFSKNKLTQVIHNEVYHDEWLHKNVFKHTLSGIVYVSNASMQKHTIHPTQKVIHNGIMSTPYLTRPRQGFIFVGRLESQKDPIACIRMYHQAIKQCQNPWPLTIIGDGSYYALVVGTINQLQQHITLIKSVGDVHPWFASSYCGLMTSVYEGYPMVLLEATQQGCPYISYDVGDVKDIIQESGWLITPQDEDAFIKTMVMVMNNPKLVSEASKKVLERSELFSAKTMVSEYESWIKERK